MTRKKGIGQEDRMQIQLGGLLRQYQGYGKMPHVIAWTYLPMGEYRKPETAAMLKKKGVNPGWGDYLFFVYNKKQAWVDIIFLELKTEKGKQQKTQQDFELGFAGACNVTYGLERSVAEAIKFLEREGILITD